MTRNSLAFRTAPSPRGFTLIELLVVIAIIGLLSSMVLSSLSTASMKSRDTRRLSDMKQVVTAVELYKESNNNVAPPHDGDQYGCSGGSNCLTALTNELVTRYIPAIPLDPQYGNAASYGYRYCRSTENTQQYSLLMWSEAKFRTSGQTTGWCNVHHPSSPKVSGASCWTTDGNPNYTWCNDWF